MGIHRKQKIEKYYYDIDDFKPLPPMKVERGNEMKMESVQSIMENVTNVLGKDKSFWTIDEETGERIAPLTQKIINENMDPSSKESMSSKLGSKGLKRKRGGDLEEGEESEDDAQLEGEENRAKRLRLGAKSSTKEDSIVKSDKTVKDFIQMSHNEGVLRRIQNYKDLDNPQKIIVPVDYSKVSLPPPPKKRGKGRRGK